MFLLCQVTEEDQQGLILRSKENPLAMERNSISISLSRFIKSFRCSSNSRFHLSSRVSLLKTRLIIRSIMLGGTRISNSKNSFNKMNIIMRFHSVTRAIMRSSNSLVAPRVMYSQMFRGTSR